MRHQLVPWNKVLFWLCGILNDIYTACIFDVLPIICDQIRNLHYNTFPPKMVTILLYLDMCTSTAGAPTYRGSALKDPKSFLKKIGGYQFGLASSYGLWNLFKRTY